MADQQYQSELAQKLYQLYQQWDKELGDIHTMGFNAILYKSSRPMLLALIQRIDEDKELRGKVQNFLRSLVEATSNDTFGKCR